VAVSVDADRIRNHVMERIMASGNGDGAFADEPAGARG